MKGTKLPVLCQIALRSEYLKAVKYFNLSLPVEPVF